jgi:hemolysin activation/secretion protein
MLLLPCFALPLPTTSSDAALSRDLAEREREKQRQERKRQEEEQEQAAIQAYVCCGRSWLCV